jgi:hypothetical protein
LIAGQTMETKIAIVIANSHAASDLADECASDASASMPTSSVFDFDPLTSWSLLRLDARGDSGTPVAF